MLAYLIPLDSPDLDAVYHRLRHEIREYSETLARKAHVVLLTKRDLLPTDDTVPSIVAPDAAGILAVSGAAGTGVEEGKEYLWKFVEAAKSEEAPVEAWRQEAED